MRRNIVLDTVTIGILAFVIAVALLAYAASTASFGSCTGICQVQT